MTAALRIAEPSSDALYFAVECWAQRTIARAVLHFEGVLDLHTAVDGCWQAAETAGLVAVFGPDEIQAAIALAFDRSGAPAADAFGAVRC